MRWVRRIGITLVVIVVLLAAFGLWAVRRPFPQTDGEEPLAGLTAPVEVVRDTDGIPHIFADNAHDLFFAQGYVHAQDRFWQMDFWRHIGSGQLAEMFGESQVPTDAFLRTMGWRQIAEEEYRNLDGELRQALDAYAAGVNAYLEEREGGELSLEHAILSLQNPGYTVEPWEPVHSLTWSKVMAWDLRANIEDEISRAVLAQELGRDRVEELYPPYPPDHPVIVPGDGSASASSGHGELPTAALAAVAEVDAAIDRVDAMLGQPFAGIGSNNWVIDGSRTASGFPLLANDPHLGIQMPSIWYEAGLHCRPRTEACPYRVVGFSFAGTPGIVIGHNDRIAWGVTNEGPDAMDLFIERIHPEDPDLYEVNGEWVRMEVRTEVIEVAGGDPVEIEVRSTRHGPIVSGRLGDLDELEGGVGGRPERFAVALHWTALQPSTLFQAVLGLDRARGWDDFREALELFDIAAQNVVYADVEGNIGYQSTGRIPVRASGDGRFPVPGWNDDHEWEGFIPFDDLPRLFNPESGMIVTANQPVVDDAYPAFIGIDHAYGYRANRITRLLADLEQATVEDMSRLQMDAYHGFAPVLVPALLQTPAATPEAEALQEVLDGWSEGEDAFAMDADSAGAAAFAVVWRQLLEMVFDELPADHQPGGGDRWFEVVAGLLSAPDSFWWDAAGTAQVEDRDAMLAATLAAAADELRAELGGDPEGWRWGDLHRAVFSNETFGQSGIAPIEALFNRSAPPRVGGSSAVVNATGWHAPSGYEVLAVPSMRMVVDLADLSRSVAINATGQSGHAFHQHYSDQIEPWTEGGIHPMRWTDEQIERDAAGRLRLVPAG